MIMSRFKIRFIDVIYWIALFAADILVYIVLGLLLMSYDDNYDASKGEYWSWKSMNTFDRYAYVALNIWHVVDVVVVVFVGYKLYKRLMMRTTRQNQTLPSSL